MSDTSRDIRSFRLPPAVVAPLREGLPEVAVQTIEAITAEVPAYTEAFAGELGAKIEIAVRAALSTFLELVSRSAGSDADSPLAAALAGAYALGRGEARSGRSLDALLAAYRVGARVAWRELAAISVQAQQGASMIARFAELVFAYIDELSAASVAGHAAELASSGRAHQRHLDRLAQALVAGETEHAVIAAAQRAEWAPPQTLTAVLVPERTARSAADVLDPRTLLVAEAGPAAPEMSALLVPDAHGAHRGGLMHLVRGQGAVVGPPRPWLGVGTSIDRAIRVLQIAAPRAAGAAVDTEDHLVTLVVTADAGALADLRVKVLAPLAGEREPAATKLADTLRSWLSHQGRRDDVAADLFIHPQTVRYRMTRLRDLYGDRLRDPEWLRALTIALTVPGRAER
ncbi:MAG TPA: helix-turn-helix domain-containing protein [Actinoplanes sp.]|nr:helix-turn-helix domain-containing protein [Actinoplanes sp.]